MSKSYSVTQTVDPTSPIALGVFAFLILVGLVIGIWSARRSKYRPSSEESKLRFGSTIVGLSASASGNSAFIMVGAVGLGYVMGISALWIAFGFWLGDIFFWYFAAKRLVGRVQEEQVGTIGELIASQVINHRQLILRIAAAVVLVAVGLYCVAQFLAVSKVLSAFLNISAPLAIVIAVVVGLMSVLLGGLGSSILVNAYQGALMVISVITVIIGTIIGLARSPELLALPNEKSSALLDPFAGFTVFSFSVFLITMMLMGFTFAMSNPHVLTRVTKGNVDKVPRVRWVYMGFMQSLWWSMTLVGVALAMLGTVASDPDQALVFYAQESFPAVIMGIIMAGIAAASLSTGEAQLLVISDALTRDIAPDFFDSLRESGKRTALITGRVAVAVAIVLTLMFADLEVVGLLIIQSAALVSAAFAIPVLFFMINEKVSGYFMALLMVAGIVSTALTRASGFLTDGKELLAGVAVSFVIIAVGYALKRSKV